MFSNIERVQNGIKCANDTSDCERKYGHNYQQLGKEHSIHTHKYSPCTQFTHESPLNFEEKLLTRTWRKIVNKNLKKDEAHAKYNRGNIKLIADQKDDLFYLHGKTQQTYNKFREDRSKIMA